MNTNFGGCPALPNDDGTECPIRGDYRLFTDWRPRCAVQYPADVRVEAGQQPPSAHEYRAFLTNNAQRIMEANALSAKTRARCGPPCDARVDPPSWQERTALREYDTQTCDGRTCSFERSVPMGLGRGGRGGVGPVHATSDIERNDVGACCGNPMHDALRSGPDAPIVGSTSMARWTVPSGGLV